MDSGVFGSLFKKRWSIKDLMDIDETRQTKAAACIVTHTDTFHVIQKETILGKFKKFFTRDKATMNVYYVVFKFNVVSDSGSANTVYIQTQPDFNGTEFMNNKVQIYCSCKDFMYRSAWVLKQHESLYRSLETDQKLGTALVDEPKATTKTSILCKHAYAALRFLSTNYSTLMRNL